MTLDAPAAVTVNLGESVAPPQEATPASPPPLDETLDRDIDRMCNDVAALLQRGRRLLKFAPKDGGLLSKMERLEKMLK